MTSTNDYQKTAQAACEAAARGDAATVVKCLESRPVVDVPTGLDEPLLPMSPSAQYLLQHLNDGPFHPEHALRALMSISSSYETPWRAALCMIQAFHSQSGNLGKQSGKVLWTCVTDVQTFLQQSVELWWKLERQRTSSTRKRSTAHNFTTTNVVPRQLLEELVDAILTPLGSNDEMVCKSSRDNQHWTQPLELVTTIVALCQDFEEMNTTGTTLSDYILNRLFPSSQQAIRPSRLLTWLTVVSDLRSYLRSNDWTRLHDILYESITQNTESIPPSDMPGLVRAIVSFLVKQHDENHSWEILILHLLHSASQHATTYSTVETVLKTSLASLPNPVLKRCIHAIKGGCGALPEWICSNMNLLLLQAVQESGSQLVSSLVSRALGRQGDGVSSTDWQRQCWESLKHFAFPSITDVSSDDQRRKQSDKSMVETVKSMLEGVEYLGNGEFVTNGEKSSILSSKLVYQSIFLGQPKPSKQSHHIFASERAQLWINAANTILRPSHDGGERDGTTTTLDAIFAILITVTVYCEVPVSRSTIVRTIVQCLSGTTSYMVSKNLPAFHCAVVALIVQSIPRHSDTNDGTRDLYPLADTFGESLSKDVFIDLTTALSPLPPARSALLSISRKYLQSSFGGNLWWSVGTASRGMQESRDRLDCALHGLCTLIATESQQSWDDRGVDSWTILSEILVQNKPALHMNQRSALFRRLESFAKQGRFSCATIEHLQRACLVRLLQFFYDETEQSLEFVPEQVFVCWGSSDATNTAGLCISQREDMCGLLRLVMMLLGSNTRVCDAEAKAFSQGREKVLRLLSNNVSPNGAFESTENPVTLTDETMFLYSSIAFSCVESILRLAMPGTASTETTRLVRNTDTRFIERWQKHLISLEIGKYKACRTNLDPEKRLSWLHIAFSETVDSPSHHVTPCDPRMKSQLLCALCDVALDLIFYPDFSDDNDNLDEEIDRLQHRRRILNCATSLICTKIDLSEDQSVGIRIKNLELEEVTFASSTLLLSSVPLLDLYGFFVKDALSHKISLDESEDMFISLLTYCSALKQLVSDEESSESDLTLSRSVEIANQLWSLYCDIGDEEAARRLVTYLEEQALSQFESNSSMMASRRSFLTINVDADVDRIVRRVRFSIISTMSVWFESLVRRSSIESSKILLVNVPSALASHANDGIGSASFWVQCLHNLSLDLKAGLDGLSGGMTEALYSTYMSLIESTCKLASPTESHEIGESLASQISGTTLECSMLLKNIVCSFPLRSAAQFKKTMILAASDLPALRRKVVLLLVASGRAFTSSSPIDWGIDVFYQMMHVTKKVHGLDKKGALWAEIVEPEHSTTPEDDNPVDKDDGISDCDKSAIDSSAGESSRVPSMISIPSNSVNQTNGKDDTNAKDDTSSKKIEKKVQLPSKESLIWASCCSLAAMEQVWSESLLILSGNTAVHGIPVSPRTASSWTPYSLERTKLLSNTLEALCFAMKSLEELDDAQKAPLSSKEGTKPVILAATFSDAVKIRFCMLLEKVSTVLQVAVRSISNHLKKGDDVGDLVRAESLSCLTSWLAVTLDGKSIEFLTSRWYHAEKKLSRGKSNSDGTHQRQSPALKRLPKFLVRSQELENDLSRVYQMLLKSSQEESSLQQQVVQQYDSLLNTRSNDENASVSLQSLIKTKLKSLSKDRASSEMFGLIGDEGGTPRKRSRKVPSLDRQMRRERRRNIKRSRNRIVDNWLHLDDDYEMDEGANDDAFVDLEDFLVDG